MNLRECNRCHISKELGEFYANASCRGGVESICKDCRRGQARSYYQRNSDQVNSKRALRTDQVRVREAAARRAWERKSRADDPEGFRERNRAKAAKKRARNPQSALANKVRNRIASALRRRGFSKNTRTAEMLGCSWEELLSHLAEKFEPGMTFDNHGAWHVDHIIPLASARDEAALIALCHFTNLQPMWGADNIRKGARV